MHRLSRISKYSQNATQSATKFVQFGGPPTEQADRHNVTSNLVNTSTSNESLNTKMLIGNVSSSPQLGGMVSRMFIRHSATFQLHPEKLKQIMRERDGQHLCNYYDSDSYKMKAVNVVEEQNRVINEGTPKNLKDTDVIYEHMLSCAQPRQKPKLIVIKKKKPDVDSEVILEAPKLIKSKLRISGRKRRNEIISETGLPVKEAQIVYSPDTSTKKEGMTIKDYRRQYRKRTTILPVYLKKMQNNLALKEKLANKYQEFSDKSANKFDGLSINYENQLLNSRKPVYVVKEYDHDSPKHEKDEDHKKRERLINVDYENELLNMDRFKVRTKYADGGEQNRHWYQNPNAGRKIERIDNSISNATLK